MHFNFHKKNEGFQKKNEGFFCYSQPQYCTNVLSKFYQNCIKNASSLDHHVQEFYFSNFWEITAEVSTSCFFNQLHSRKFKSGFTEKRVLSIRPLYFHTRFFLKYPPLRCNINKGRRGDFFLVHLVYIQNL